MKIAITGTTRGLGKALCGFLTYNDHELVEFNRNDGFDISKDSGRKNIIDKLNIEPVEVFINNAWADNGTGQLYMFNDVMKLYDGDTSKTIVNINSIASLIPFNTQHPNPLYGDSKRNLKDQSAQYFYSQPRPRIINVYPGYIGTELNHEAGVTGNVITLEEACNIITWAISNPLYIEISDLSFQVINKKQSR